MNDQERTVERDVRDLGDELGAVIRRHTSDAAFAAVEDVRTGSIDYRRGDADARAPVRERLSGLDPETTRTVARAFATYFELVNVAEERQRIRAVRRAEGSLADGLDATADALAEVDADTAARALADVRVVPTFTAHPTEARRKTVKAKLRRVSAALADLDERRLTDDEAAALRDDLDAEVASLWATRQVRSRRPTPLDEARDVRWYLEGTLFDVLGETYDALTDAVAEAHPDLDVPPVLEFRSWAGSDRDGNPHVTPEVTTETLDAQRAAVLDRYDGALADLAGAASHEAGRVTHTDAFADRVDAEREALPRVAADLADEYPGEPYRQYLHLLRERVDRVDDLRPGGFDASADLDAALGALADDSGRTATTRSPTAGSNPSGGGSRRSGSRSRRSTSATTAGTTPRPWPRSSTARGSTTAGSRRPGGSTS